MPHRHLPVLLRHSSSAHRLVPTLKATSRDVRNQTILLNDFISLSRRLNAFSFASLSRTDFKRSSRSDLARSICSFFSLMAYSRTQVGSSESVQWRRKRGSSMGLAALLPPSSVSNCASRSRLLWSRSHVKEPHIRLNDFPLLGVSLPLRSLPVSSKVPFLQNSSALPKHGRQQRSN